MISRAMIVTLTLPSTPRLSRQHDGRRHNVMFPGPTSPRGNPSRTNGQGRDSLNICSYSCYC